MFYPHHARLLSYQTHPIQAGWKSALSWDNDSIVGSLLRLIGKTRGKYRKHTCMYIMCFIYLACQDQSFTPPYLLTTPVIGAICGGDNVGLFVLWTWKNRPSVLSQNVRGFRDWWMYITYWHLLKLPLHLYFSSCHRTCCSFIVACIYLSRFGHPLENSFADTSCSHELRIFWYSLLSTRRPLPATSKKSPDFWGDW